ncbi:hypothetical protein D7Z54_06840 [Salibacterium salarium]|uniref:Uncharacterized protein n=1 Tax=Salibacterium salarium TaxID=284579 RepID=A0A3R9Q5W5_9BACI|nr:hypothetical protein [Salibacterium salarium]RSL34267.1 hypothetical protein D7Z54_06840 [Salibacterium salarium]
MKPFYVIGVAVLVCFTIIGTAATILLYDSADDSNSSKTETKSTEELAGELDEALGVDSSEEKSDESSSTKEGQTEQQNDTDDEAEELEEQEGTETVTDKDRSAALASAPSSEDINESVRTTESSAISLGPDDESVPIDELMKIINE